MCHTDSLPTDRYAADVISLHRTLSFRGLLKQDRATLTHLAERGDGLATVAVPTRHLPHRYLVGLQGFRLAQYLQLGWACSTVAYRNALFCEPVQAVHADDEHVITIGPDGRILGYVSLATNGDPTPYGAFDQRRRPFPVEVAHGVNIFDHVAPLPDVRSDQVRELKRFVHSRSLTDKTQRLRVSLELLAGLGHVMAAADPRVATLVGDVEEQVALRHLLMAGLEVQLVEGTTPVLDDTDLLQHAYTARESVKPFVSHVPDSDFVAERVQLLEETLASPDLFAATTEMGARRGTLNRVGGEGRAS